MLKHVKLTNILYKLETKLNVEDVVLIVMVVFHHLLFVWNVLKEVIEFLTLQMVHVNAKMDTTVLKKQLFVKNVILLVKLVLVPLITVFYVLVIMLP